MSHRLRFVFLGLVAVGALFAFPTAASAEHGSADLASPNMQHLANRGHSGTTNSDLAFWSGGPLSGFPKIAVAGNYGGFRIFDIRQPEDPVLITNFICGPTRQGSNQGDVSLYQAKNRLLLIQSVDRPVTTDDCALAVPTPVAIGVPSPGGFPPRPLNQPGFEGLRIFDITDPTTPVHIASVPTACGSHTHTTIPDKDNQRAVVYVSSYPTGASPTPADSDFGGPRCTIPHQRISIVEIHDDSPETPIVRESMLSPDTLPFRGTIGSGGTGAIGCHDITVLFEANQGPESNPKPQKEVAAGACLSEGQLWDISDPANPQTFTEGRHTHIRNPFIDQPTAPIVGGLFHTASFTWDGEVVLFTDEWQGGGAHGCDGPQDHRGNTWFYKNVEPGTPVAPLFGRYMIPRAQPANEICTLHNGNVIPTNEGYFGVSASYEGGTSVFDFTGVQDRPVVPQPPVAPVPLVAEEIAFFDAQGVDGRGRDDTWSSYWYNDFIYVNGGLGGLRTSPTVRGFDVYRLLGMHGRLVEGFGEPAVSTAAEANRPNAQQYRARKFHYENPQTQETFQALGHGQR